ncbi:hypothetical protein E8E15_010689 [Penicillium rubens]|jgi:hypothetical protein|uniref:Pc12g08730 protein n=2 Tax=Penicillium chrysogenum species complex TaxID=254878 RepID=B6GYK2_PENRW|nr:uncharacterized protein N7525_001690 [Penicillium rubens]KZN85087.1 O-GlcNAcase NagJ [Penicillium chrysogenum]CAP80500.1 Pc12g08730 [Penicillium rubens Wisconsin 54-1255]KAF3029056.1 hypothetical protein E8E15_010689 [Penicillium rubens]KAJ5034346.1 hypothetical protein NUH16_005783 [Penicillium rubens]KAJ5843949.1 hypothetical protein N7525_001690 [Penicillium rubens]
MFNLHRITCLRAFLVALALGPVNAAPITHNDLAGREDGGPAVWPTPQEITLTSGKVSLTGDVTIVTDDFKDSATISKVKEVIAAAGGNAVLASKSSGNGTQIFVGTEAEAGVAVAAAKALAGNSANGLDADGYVFASGNYEQQPSIVLNGVDTRGTFYAAQTLRQLLDGDHIPGIKVRDWPLMSIRGSIEGFYGVPWSHEARLDQFAFYGKHKMNTYVYTPKDDLLLRAKWRTLYSGDELTQLKELVETANANHVDFTYALSPGLDVCYSSDEDFDATVAKFNQLRDFGVSNFYIALDDIPLEFHCDADKKKWPKTKNDEWIADAQTFYLNRVQTEYIEPNNLEDLETVPTHYAGSATSPYKTEFGTKLNKKIRVQWTGEGVFSDEITVDSVVAADKSYVTENLFLWDNFPVNDANRDRLFLNPLTKRAAELYKHLLGFTSNPMNQPYASMATLANYGDYTWNGPSYDATKSTEASLWELSGTDTTVHNALIAFTDLNQNWPYQNPQVNATQLNKDITAFWTARKAGTSDGTGALKDRLELIISIPDVLPDMAMKAFATDVAPWATVAKQWATACKHLIAMLEALDDKDQSTADAEFNSAKEWVEKTKAKTVDDRNAQGEDLPKSIVPTTGDGAFDKFLTGATAIYDGK